VLKKLTAAGIVAAAASGALLLAAPANAGIGGLGGGNGGVLSGNQFIVPVSIPVNICGNSVAVLGFGRAGCRGGASGGQYHHGHHPHWVS
jgi:ChpA-C